MFGGLCTVTLVVMTRATGEILHGGSSAKGHTFNFFMEISTWSFNISNIMCSL